MQNPLVASLFFGFWAVVFAIGAYVAISEFREARFRKTIVRRQELEERRRAEEAVVLLAEYRRRAAETGEPLFPYGPPLIVADLYMQEERERLQRGEQPSS